MNRNSNNQLFALVHQVDATLDPYFSKKAPQLPSNIQELLAKLTPYFTIIGVIFAALGLLIYLGITAFASPVLIMMGGVSGAQAVTGGVIGLVFLVIQGVLEALAIQGLFNRQRSAWNYLYLASLVGMLYNLVSLNLIGLVINFLISFYLLYQIKSYYNK